MNMLKSTGLIIAILFTTFQAKSQEYHSDIGVLLTTASYSRVGVEWRKPINEKWKFNLGAMYGSSSPFSFFNSGQIIDANDTLVTHRKYDSYSNYVYIMSGAEMQFGESMFSIFGNLMVGYRITNQRYYNSYTSKDSLGEWGYPFPTIDYLDNDYATRNTHHIEPRIQIGFNMDVPIGKRFLLNLRVMNNLGTSFYLTSTKIQDPNNEFHDYSNSFYLNYDINAGIGLRYKFGVKKE